MLKDTASTARLHVSNLKHQPHLQLQVSVQLSALVTPPTLPEQALDDHRAIEFTDSKVRALAKQTYEPSRFPSEESAQSPSQGSLDNEQ